MNFTRGASPLCDTILKSWLESVGVVGELSLDGGLRGARGALSMAEGVRREGITIDGVS